MNQRHPQGLQSRLNNSKPANTGFFIMENTSSWMTDIFLDMISALRSEETLAKFKKYGLGVLTTKEAKGVAILSDTDTVTLIGRKITSFGDDDVKETETAYEIIKEYVLPTK